jgi:hypothetical protein
MYIYSVQAVQDGPLNTNQVTVVDGYTVKQFDYILLINQTNPKDNGVFMVQADQTLTRSSDFLMFGPFFQKFRITVINGDTYAGARFVLEVPMGSSFDDLEQDYVRNYDPDPSPEDNRTNEEKVQARLDDFAKTKGYDDIATCISYLGSTNTTWAAEAARANTLRDATWAAYYANETEPWPTIEAALPELTWA